MWISLAFAVIDNCVQKDMELRKGFYLKVALTGKVMVIINKGGAKF